MNFFRLRIFDWKKIFLILILFISCIFINLSTLKNLVKRRKLNDIRTLFSTGATQYRVFKRKTWCFEHLLGHQNCTYKSLKRYLYIQEMRKFDLWSLDLVENNIPVLHSLSPERWQNFTWNSIIPFRNIFVQKHQNKVILAISLLISRT